MNGNKNARPRGTDAAKVIRVIETISLKGCGADNDPVRVVKQYWKLDGSLIVESDPFIDEEYEKLSQQFSHTR